MKRKLEAFGSVITWLTIVIQLVLMIQNRVASVPETLIRFFSFFTILTNLLVALYFTIRFFKWKKRPLQFFFKPEAITAITVFILIVGLVYQFVLRPIWEPTGLQLVVDEFLHSVIPVYFLIYWLITIRHTAPRMKLVFLWLAYPVLYITFILMRGSVSGYYPYPFLHIGEIGLSSTLWNMGAILGVMILLMIGLTLVGKWIQKDR
ncbi:Pr6Pr family membrane protein [Membranicola marinus]|uniref:Pr6Pr family membrane protein n=1 Tax=Membranihabitans marinus TaxID=1227546 RepID=A0A953HM38_9BACT|nr:Pr6Pr family membrane protein [Membranihabitans marinus]MBY5958479.1 Pr6Pr family membrane protein [Membranihabitans marinus]